MRWAVWGCFAASPTWAATDDSNTAFVALRPTTDAQFRTVDLARLPEGQTLRGLAESVLEAVSGRAVLRHEALREVLGPGYLVQLFDCRGALPCLRAQLQPLRARNVERVMVGDYWVSGERYGFRLRSLPLDQDSEVTEERFEVSRHELTSLEAWAKPLERLFDDTGSLRIVTNVSGYDCTLDGRSCSLTKDGKLEGVRQGEHVLSLGKAGYQDATRVLRVEKGRETSVAVAMERLPTQLPAAPDPRTVNPVFSASKEPSISPFGFVAITFGLDNQNNGESIDLFAAPPSAKAGFWHTAALTTPLALGAQAQSPQLGSGWSGRAALLIAGILPGTGIDFFLAYAALVNDTLGFSLTMGILRSPVNGLGMGLLTIPVATGDLQAELIGVSARQSFGRWVLEGGLGKLRPKAYIGPPLGATTLPTVFARAAYVNAERMGRLNGAPYPLSVSVSGMFGWERYGLEDPALVRSLDPSAALPIQEDVPYWIGSVELFAPLSQWLSVSGEGYVGQLANNHYGAFLQGALLELSTGRHLPSRSAGGWLQLSISPREDLDFRLVGGHERMLTRLTEGVLISAPGQPLIRWNNVVALSINFSPVARLWAGLQLHRLDTGYVTPLREQGSLWGLTSQVSFSF